MKLKSTEITNTDSVGISASETHSDSSFIKRRERIWFDVENEALYLLAVGRPFDQSIDTLARAFEERHSGLLCAVHLHNVSEAQQICVAAPTLGSHYADAFDAMQLEIDETRLPRDHRLFKVHESLEDHASFDYVRRACPSLLVKAAIDVPLRTKSRRCLGWVRVFSPFAGTLTDRQHRHLKRLADSVTRILKVQEKRSVVAGNQQRAVRKQSADAVSHLANSAAHKLNNLLTSVVCNAEFIEKSDATKEVAEAVQSILTACDSASEIATRLQLIGGSGSQKQEPLNVLPLVIDSVNKNPSVTQRKVRVVHSHSSCQSFAAANAPLLREALSLMVDLCREAASCSIDEITVSLSREFLSASELPKFCLEERLPEGEYINLAYVFEDPKFEVDKLDSLLEPLPLLTNRATDQFAMLLGILKKHLGGLNAIDKNDGRVSLTLSIPATDACRDPKMPETTSTSKRLRILLVDDEDVVRDSLFKLLKIYGNHEVTMAASGLEAIDVFETGPDEFDVALIDQRMPEIGGTETGKRLRSTRPELPIVFISGYCDFGEGSVHEQPIVDDITGSLEKPLRTDDLIAELSRVTLK